MNGLCGCCRPYLFVVKFVEILSNRNQKYFQPNRFFSSSYDSLIPSIILHNTECSFRLYRTVHPEQRSLYAFQIRYDFLVHGCEFAIDPHCTIPICLFTLFCIRTSATVFALIHFFLSAVCIPFYILAILQVKGFSIRAPHNSIFVNQKVDCSERVFLIFPIRCFLLEHWELHILFHSILLTKNVIVVGTVAGICNRIFRIESTHWRSGKRQWSRL